MLKKRSLTEHLFDSFNVIVLFLFAMITVIPYIHIVAGSFASESQLLRSSFLLFPTEFSLKAYEYIFSSNTVFRSILVTIYLTVVGTTINILFTSIMAYPLAKKHLNGRSLIMFMVIFSMLFGGGMIPSFLLVRELGMLNTLWALMIPGAINAFYLIILKNFFQQLPDGLEESARIDGCNDVSILFRIVLPLSMPAIATLTLFYAVGHWNTFMQALIYINNAEKWPIQVLLRSIILLADGLTGAEVPYGETIPKQTVKMAVIVVATFPILSIYPFLQKHFAKGVLLGSVKG